MVVAWSGYWGMRSCYYAVVRNLTGKGWGVEDGTSWRGPAAVLQLILLIPLDLNTNLAHLGNWSQLAILNSFMAQIGRQMMLLWRFSLKKLFSYILTQTCMKYSKTTLRMAVVYSQNSFNVLPHWTSQTYKLIILVCILTHSTHTTDYLYGWTRISIPTKSRFITIINSPSINRIPLLLTL